MQTDSDSRMAIYSFGFKYGAPVDVNLLFDVRFLPNPYWDEQLRPFTGQDPRVRDYVLQSASGQSWLELLTPLLKMTLAEVAAGGRRRLTIAIGCTGGRHRSVAVTEYLGEVLREQGFALTVFHRDILREG